MVVLAFNPSTLGGRGRQISEFEASLVYRVNSRTARATKRNSVSNKTKQNKTGMVVLAFNPSTLGGRGRQISEFEASLVYRVNSRTARATKRNSVSNKTKQNKTKTTTTTTTTTKQQTFFLGIIPLARIKAFSSPKMRFQEEFHCLGNHCFKNLMTKGRAQMPGPGSREWVGWGAGQGEGIGGFGNCI
jgi:RNase P/RNase MRP subunit p29